MCSFRWQRPLKTLQTLAATGWAAAFALRHSAANLPSAFPQAAATGTKSGCPPKVDEHKVVE